MSKKYTQHKLLIANRGEIAIRIINAANELGIPTVTIFSEDDSLALHTRKSNQTLPLKGKGVSAYLNIEHIIALAKSSGSTLIHPGYGFLSENAQFARRCQEENLIFIGPSPEILDLFGDKAAARKLAEEVGVPLLLGTSHPTNLSEAQNFFNALPVGTAMMVKSMAGGGGRGMRIVEHSSELVSVFEQCAIEAKKAFGDASLYVETYLPLARHIEVQIIGDGQEITHLYERECSIQRNNQKLIEIAPCPGLEEGLRSQIIEAAVNLAKAVNYQNAGTFEFLINGINLTKNTPFYFLEVNPRIQVEHTVTEEVLGIDLVQFQIQQALGANLKELGLNQTQIPLPNGIAIQARINTETIDKKGNAILKVGKLTSFEMPYGKGVRVEAAGYPNYANSPAFDTLLAKLIVRTKTDDFSQAIKHFYRQLSACNIQGITTNLSLLQNILSHPLFEQNQFHTKFIKEHLYQLLEDCHHPKLFFSEASNAHIKQSRTLTIPQGLTAILAPMPGSITAIAVKKGTKIEAGQALLVIEAMKMESLVEAEVGGIIEQILIKKGDVVNEQQALFFLKPNEEEEEIEGQIINYDLDIIRPELAELQERKALLHDENRPIAVSKRKKKAKQTARENIAQLCDKDTFLEFGSLIVAAQRSRRKLEDLMVNTPADGIITGIGAINGKMFEQSAAKCMILCYDYTVLAGTQGMMGHLKTDRALEMAHQSKLPVILFAEGGGGRPGDTDFQGIGGLHVKTFSMFTQLNGIAPRIAIVSGYCFAGNAALAGCADVIIATQDTSIGMGGPAMIEGGGLGRYHPKEVGPVEVQNPNGVIDILVKDENEAIEVSKKYLSYFQGTIGEWDCADQRILRNVIPENRRRVYDIRRVIHTLADKDSVLELRKDYAIGVVTVFIRIEGRPLGLIANNPKHLGGALDAEGSGKAARFIQLCDVFNIPIVSLCDTPGFMVGPEAEKTALVRHTARLFTAGAKAKVPFFTIVLRKAYGLGSMGMAAGGTHEPFFTVSWPTGEFGGMGLEGAVRLGYRKELEAIQDPVEREALFEKMVAKSYQHGKAINTASFLEIDEVIDPLDTRKWIMNGLISCTSSKASHERGRGFVDTW